MSIICKKWTPITRRCLDGLAEKSEDAVTEKIIKILNDVEYVSLTVDVWTDTIKVFSGCHSTLYRQKI